MNAAVARGLGVGFFVSILLVVQAARGEVYEVVLPEVIGEYLPPESFPRSAGTRREFEFDLGTPLAEIHDLRLRLEGSMTAQLNWRSGASPMPVNLQFVIHLENETGLGYARGWSPSAGKATYPEPMPFAGGYFGEYDWTDWSFLKAGAARGYVELQRPWRIPEDYPSGGSGTITGAWLIIEATPVPEPAVLTAAGVAVVRLLRRRRREGYSGGSGG